MHATSSRIAALAKFDRLLARVLTHHAVRIPGVLGYSPTDLAARLTQRFAQLYQSEFIVAYCRTALHQPSAWEGLPHPQRVALGDVRVSLSDGTVTLSAGLALRLLFDFLARWCYTLLNLLASIRVRPDRGSATLVYGVGLSDIFRGGDDKEFLAYCGSGPITPLQAARLLVVQAPARAGRTTSPRAVYARSPLHALCRVTGLSPVDAMKLVGRHFIALFCLTRLCAVVPPFLLAARDFSEEVPATALDQAAAIEAVVLTNSNYSSQPLWMWARSGRRFRVHMVWYSQNIRPLLRKSDPDFPVDPINRLIRADIMWVWMPSFADYLTAIGIRAEMRCVGPILWNLPELQPAEPRNSPVIAVFDVTPTTEAEAIRLGLVDNYYTLATTQKFLQDIIEAVRLAATELGRHPRIALKHKREGKADRDPGYFRFVEELIGTHGNLVVLPAHTSLYEMLSNCDVAIAIPCSSPVYVASHLGKPSIFYDPTGELKPVFDAAPELEFVSGPALLAATVSRILKRGVWANYNRNEAGSLCE